MIAALVHHEWRLLATTAAGRALVIGTTLAAAISVFVGWSQHSRFSADIAAARTFDQARHHALAAALARPAQRADALPAWGAAHPEFVANERGRLVTLPPPPFGVLATGLSDVQPALYRVTARTRFTGAAGDQVSSPLSTMAGPFDVAFVVVYLYPLLVLAAAADLTASDRATGRLRLVLAQGVSIRSVVACRALMRVAAVTLPVIAAVVAAGLMGAEPHAERGRLVLFVAAVAAYGLFWTGLSVVANARARSAAASALTLVAAWVVLIVLMPAAINLLVRTLAPVPSRVELATATRRASQQAISESSRLLGRFLEDHPSSGVGLEGMQQYAALQAARDTAVARAVQPLMDAHETRVRRQRDAVQRLQYISPAVLAWLALTDAAGASGHRHRWFLAQVSRYQEEWRRFFAARLAAVAPLDRTDYDAMPAFAFIEEPAGAAAARIVLPVAALTAAAALLIVAGLRFYGHYDVAA